jgi:hypothetical protein
MARRLGVTVAILVVFTLDIRLARDLQEAVGENERVVGNRFRLRRRGHGHLMRLLMRLRRPSNRPEAVQQTGQVSLERGQPSGGNEDSHRNQK